MSPILAQLTRAHPEGSAVKEEGWVRKHFLMEKALPKPEAGAGVSQAKGRTPA